MRKPALALLPLMLTACASTPSPSAVANVELVPRYERAPQGCRTVGTVSTLAEESAFLGLFSSANYRRQARLKLRKEASEEGGDHVHVTAMRAYLGPYDGSGVVRVEMEGRVLQCSTSDSSPE